MHALRCCRSATIALVFDDPAVQSVRVALALCDRFTELMKGPTTVRAAKQRGALVGVAGDQEGLSMRIGEAQQIYPEIWQHLDTARATLAKRGVDVAAFDRIREAEGQALGANVGLETHSYGYGSRGVDQQVKTAGFNAQGVGRARQACKALMDATPDIDWKAIAAAESADPAAADFARSTRNKRYARFAALALLIVAPFGIVMYMRHRERVKLREYQAQYTAPDPDPMVQPGPPSYWPPTAEERALWDRTSAEVRPWLVAAQASWATVMDRAALAALVPGAAPCPHVGASPEPEAVERFVRHGEWDVRFAASNYFWNDTGTRPIAATAVSTTKQSLDWMAQHFADNKVTRADREWLPRIPRFFVVVDVLHEKRPRRTKDSFVPGEVSAHAYVYSLAEQKVVCKGHLEVRNQPPETSPYAGIRRPAQGPDILDRELDMQIRQALATNLHAL